MTTILPASGRHYVCFDNPADNSRFFQIAVIGWQIDKDTQPIPITAFGPADTTQPIPMSQHFDNEGAEYYILPGSQSDEGGLFFPVHVNQQGQMKAYLQERAQRPSPPPPPIIPTPPVPPPAVIG